MRKASDCWCPFVRHSIETEVGFNRSRLDGIDTVGLWNACLGSKCSAWQNINHHSMEELAEVIEGQYGRCGLSNGGLMEDE